jgi:hypothetical protein
MLTLLLNSNTTSSSTAILHMLANKPISSCVVVMNRNSYFSESLNGIKTKGITKGWQLTKYQSTLLLSDVKAMIQILLKHFIDKLMSRISYFYGMSTSHDRVHKMDQVHNFKSCFSMLVLSRVSNQTWGLNC